MFGIKYLCFLAGFLPAVLSTTLPPTFTKLYNGAVLLDIPANPIVAGPFGTRTLIKIEGGNLTDPITGDVATIIPGLGGETGVMASNNVFYASVQAGFQWVDDRKSAWAELHGVAELTGGNAHIRFETDSPARTKLNGLFTIYTINTSTVPATLAIYGLYYRTGEEQMSLHVSRLSDAM
ncbi:hypothetical protein C8J56DRAFT_1082258 [Mycena floridula]|nr:hypothetical protein C8J56DRAFT_1082258 [Mycena floridula]